MDTECAIKSVSLTKELEEEEEEEEEEEQKPRNSNSKYSQICEHVLLF